MRDSQVISLDAYRQRRSDATVHQPSPAVGSALLQTVRLMHDRRHRNALPCTWFVLGARVSQHGIDVLVHGDPLLFTRELVSFLKGGSQRFIAADSTVNYAHLFVIETATGAQYGINVIGATPTGTRVVGTPVSLVSHRITVSAFTFEGQYAELPGYALIRCDVGGFGLVECSRVLDEHGKPFISTVDGSASPWLLNLTDDFPTEQTAQ